jgi:hypothetical protein
LNMSEKMKMKHPVVKYFYELRLRIHWISATILLSWVGYN